MKKLSGKRKNLFDNHFRAVYFRMYHLLKKNDIVHTRQGLKTKDLISMFLELTRIVAPEGIDKKEFLVQLYRSMESKYLPPPEYSFYQTKEWLVLRKKILSFYGHVCMKCGRQTTSPHIDHIKPKSTYPELSLEIKNLQVLCMKCNIGKSNRNEIDYRVNNLMGRDICTTEMSLSI